jgi:hypothetical protein
VPGGSAFTIVSAASCVVVVWTRLPGVQLVSPLR